MAEFLFFGLLFVCYVLPILIFIGIVIVAFIFGGKLLKSFISWLDRH